MATKVICFHCQKENPVLGKLGLREECFSCKSDLHVCRNCKFYDKSSYNECRETAADVVKEKERSNFCDFFEPGTVLNATAEKEKNRAAAEALFKK